MAKKSFINGANPAMQFISPPASENEREKVSPAESAPAEPSAPPAPSVPAEEKGREEKYFIAPKLSEHKSKRAQLLMTPSLHGKVAKKAASLNMSFNELVNLVLEKYVG